MQTPNDSEDDLGAELRDLGENLKQTLRTAWQSEERKKIQREIKSGLKELEGLLKEASDELHASEIRHEIQEGVSDFRERLERGELEKRIREDLLSALHTINEELKRLSAQWSAEAGGYEDKTGEDDHG